MQRRQYHGGAAHHQQQHQQKPTGQVPSPFALSLQRPAPWCNRILIVAVATAREDTPQWPRWKFQEMCASPDVQDVAMLVLTEHECYVARIDGPYHWTRPLRKDRAHTLDIRLLAGFIQEYYLPAKTWLVYGGHGCSEYLDVRHPLHERPTDGYLPVYHFARALNGKQFLGIMFDSCLMASLDAAYWMRYNTPYVAASEGYVLEEDTWVQHHLFNGAAARWMSRFSNFSSATCARFKTTDGGARSSLNSVGSRAAARKDGVSNVGGAPTLDASAQVLQRIGMDYCRHNERAQFTLISTAHAEPLWDHVQTSYMKRWIEEGSRLKPEIANGILPVIDACPPPPSAKETNKKHKTSLEGNLAASWLSDEGNSACHSPPQPPPVIITGSSPQTGPFSPLTGASSTCQSGDGGDNNNNNAHSPPSPQDTEASSIQRRLSATLDLQQQQSLTEEQQQLAQEQQLNDDKEKELDDDPNFLGIFRPAMLAPPPSTVAPNNNNFNTALLSTSSPNVSYSGANEGSGCGQQQNNEKARTRVVPRTWRFRDNFDMDHAIDPEYSSHIIDLLSGLDPNDTSAHEMFHKVVLFSCTSDDWGSQRERDVVAQRAYAMAKEQQRRRDDRAARLSGGGGGKNKNKGEGEGDTYHQRNRKNERSSEWSPQNRTGGGPLQHNNSGGTSQRQQQRHQMPRHPSSEDFPNYSRGAGGGAASSTHSTPEAYRTPMVPANAVLPFFSPSGSKCTPLSQSGAAEFIALSTSDNTSQHNMQQQPVVDSLVGSPVTSKPPQQQQRGGGFGGFGGGELPGFRATRNGSESDGPGGDGGENDDEELSSSSSEDGGSSSTSGGSVDSDEEEPFLVVRMPERAADDSVEERFDAAAAAAAKTTDNGNNCKSAATQQHRPKNAQAAARAPSVRIEAKSLRYYSVPLTGLNFSLSHWNSNHVPPLSSRDVTRMNSILSRMAKNPPVFNRGGGGAVNTNNNVEVQQHQQPQQQQAVAPKAAVRKTAAANTQ